MNDKTEAKVIEPDTQLKTIKPTGPVTPMTLLAMATEQGADLDKMQQLMEMQMTWEANEAKKAFVEAMSNFTAKCPTIVKDSLVDYDTQKGRTTYKHASLAGAIAQIKDLLGEFGLSHSWVVEQDKTAITVTCKITHAQGHSESTSLIGAADTSGGKNSIQAIGSAVSYLQRYTLFSILGLASADQDDDGASSELITEDQVETLRNIITTTKADIGLFLKFAKVEKLDEILMRDFGKCESALNASAKK